jgi:hypothetical protein
MQPISRRPSPALLVAVIALVAALAGTATALPGKNKVDKNDIKKGAVKSKAIKKNAVKAKHVADGAVGTAEIADGSVAEADVAEPEARHLVGAAGEPQFSNGGQGDCEWSSAHTQLPGFEPVSFWKDSTGLVHMNGIALREDGSGGDGVCDPFDPGEEEDGVIFTMPAGHAPALTQIQGIDSDFAVVLAGPQGLVGSGVSVPPSTVYSTSSIGQAGFDGIEFRTDSAGALSADEDGTADAAGQILRRMFR